MNLSTVKWAQWDKTQSRDQLGLFVCMCIALCTIVAHNIAQNRPDNFPPYTPDNHHCSDNVYLREGGGAASVVTGWTSYTLIRVGKSLSLGLAAEAEALAEVVAECATFSYQGRVSSGPLAMDPDDKMIIFLWFIRAWPLSLELHTKSAAVQYLQHFIGLNNIRHNMAFYASRISKANAKMHTADNAMPSQRTRLVDELATVQPRVKSTNTDRRSLELSVVNSYFVLCLGTGGIIIPIHLAIRDLQHWNPNFNLSARVGPTYGTEYSPYLSGIKPGLSTKCE